jgi:hypothetical protein
VRSCREYLLKGARLLEEEGKDLDNGLGCLSTMVSQTVWLSVIRCWAFLPVLAGVVSGLGWDWLASCPWYGVYHDIRIGQRGCRFQSQVFSTFTYGSELTLA